MKRNDPLLRAAMKVHRSITGRPNNVDGGIQSVAEPIVHQTTVLARYLRQSCKASSRGWHSAAALTGHKANGALRQLQYMVAGASTRPVESSPPLVEVTLCELYRELLQLHQEFDQVVIDLQHQLISIVTAAIELEGVYLGAYRIELHIDRLVKYADVYAFDIVALDPHPPSSSEDVTHPHVRDRQLCAGDATNPIAQALRSGRICDAFLAINAVLQHYNADSPYVSLDGWNGVSCGDCGQSVEPSELSYCEDCGGDYCNDCSGCCDICERSCCHSCMELDRQSHASCCRRCRHTCDRCNRVVDGNNFDSDSGYCPACLELSLEEQEAEETVQQT